MNSAGLPSVLACGAWLKNTACLLTQQGPVASQVHGDLGDPTACHALEASARRLLAQAATPVRAVAHDLHPDFYSTRLALELAAEFAVPAVAVQHHHAHIAAVMAEHDIHEPAVGLALDGVGLGTDNQPWGGELLWVSPGDWRRLGHLWPLALPGGDVAAREPWRMAAAALHALERTGEIGPRFAPRVGEASARGVQQMLERNIRCLRTTSAGRWFDAAAAALGLNVRQSHEAQAAIALERAAREWLDRRGAAALAQKVRHDVAVTSAVLDIRPLLQRLLDHTGLDVPAAAAWFHLALADALVAWAAHAAQHSGVRTVCLGGGCFMNNILAQAVTSGLRQRGLQVLMPRDNPCGDAGLALGQAWVAAHRIAQKAPAAAPENFRTKPERLLCA